MFRFCPTPPPLLLLLLCFYGWMGDRATFDVLFCLILWIYKCRALVPEGTCCSFFCNKVSSLVRLDTCGFLLVLWFDVTHTNTKKDTQHAKGQRDRHPYKYILILLVMCSEQPSVLHWTNNLLISKIYFTEFHNIFAFQKLLSCRSHLLNRLSNTEFYQTLRER